MSQCAPTPSVTGGAIKLAAVSLVVVQQRAITGVVSKNNEFKGDYCNSLAIGAKTFFTWPGFELATSVSKSEILTTRPSWHCVQGVSTL